MARNKIIARITESRNKHGKIKGKDKKETKALKYMCFHHYYSKKGNIKPATINDNNGHIVCEMCGRTINTEIRKDSDIEEMIRNMMNIVDQTKFIVEASGMGAEAEDYLAKFSVELMKFKKVYKNVTKVALKNENVKTKKKKQKSSGSGSENFGSWA